MLLTEKGGCLAGLESLRDTILLLAESKFVFTEQLDLTNSTGGRNQYESQTKARKKSLQVGSTEIESKESSYIES